MNGGNSQHQPYLKSENIKKDLAAFLFIYQWKTLQNKAIFNQNKGPRLGSRWIKVYPPYYGFSCRKSGLAHCSQIKIINMKLYVNI